MVDRRCAPAAARWPARTRRFASALLLAAAEAALAAQPPPETPFLRLDTTMHTARVRKLVVDAPRNRLLTASDDKTVRLWQLPKGRLLRVFRVPIGDGFEGRIYVADMHPDGRIVAAGGWTGWDFDGAGSIYLFDADSGELVRRIGGFPEAIGTLAFSPDGRYLAVGLLGSRGLRVLRTSDYAEVARDLEYGERILDLGFARDGRLAVASLDGYLRLYDAGFALVGRRKTTTGKQPLSIKFSPDGELDRRRLQRPRAAGGVSRARSDAGVERRRGAAARSAPRAEHPVERLRRHALRHWRAGGGRHARPHPALAPARSRPGRVDRGRCATAGQPVAAGRRAHGLLVRRPVDRHRRSRTDRSRSSFAPTWPICAHMPARCACPRMLRRSSSTRDRRPTHWCG